MDTQPIPKARQFNTRPDTLDFRDQRYRPSLTRIPATISVEDFRGRFAGHAIPILDQHTSGHCTGFALATVINCLRQLRQGPICASEPVSPHMLFSMARRYDSWQGEAYEWSSARGAMKGWHKHGVCLLRHWDADTPPPGNVLPPPIRKDAARTPLGAYYRVNHKDLVEMHVALAEVGILLATAQVHAGWSDTVNETGRIPFATAPHAARRAPEQSDQFGGIDVCHAFAIIGYDQRGFWIQNSWGEDWGHKGFGLISYDDWLINGRDVWVAQLGVPVQVNQRGDDSTTSLHEISASETTKSLVTADLRPHIISYCHHGGPQETGTYGNSLDAIRQLLLSTKPGQKPAEASPYLTPYLQRAQPLRLLVYAPDGFDDGHQAARHLLSVLPTLLHEELNIYPLFLNRRTGIGPPLLSLLQIAYEQRLPYPGAVKDAVLPSVLERLPNTLEALARARGQVLWQEWKKAAWRLFWNDGETDPVDNDLLTEQLASLPPVLDLMEGQPTKATASQRPTSTDPAKVDPRQTGCHGAGYELLLRLQELRRADARHELHLLGHGIGALAIVRLVEALLKAAKRPSSSQLKNLRVSSITLWAPACSIPQLNNTVGEYIRQRPACRLLVFTLTPEAEANDQLGPYYRRSLLHLVANSLDGRFAREVKLAGLTQELLPYEQLSPDPNSMQQLRFGAPDPDSGAVAQAALANWVVAPTTETKPRQLRSGARGHRGFATDPATWTATCAHILNIRDTPGKRDFFADRLDFSALLTAQNQSSAATTAFPFT